MSLQRAWYQTKLHPLLWLLWPLQALFVWVSNCRRWLYNRGLKASYKAPVPVIVVGNISVGGTGKTPVTEALVDWLQQRGYQPGIISRGYGGQGPFPLLVTPTSDPNQCGDEPLLLARRSRIPVVVAPNRKAAVEHLLEQHPNINIIVSDDGLQHYALQRDLELIVVDGERGLGNGWRLPMGPLRESPQRLTSGAIVVQNGGAEHLHGYRFELQPQAWRRVIDDEPVSLAADGSVIAIAGIGHPQRFFNTLQSLNIVPDSTLAFADHYAFSAKDFAEIPADTNVLMTEKDAAKCQSFARQNWYYLPVRAEFKNDFWQQLAQRLTKE